MVFESELFWVGIQLATSKKLFLYKCEQINLHTSKEWQKIWGRKKQNKSTSNKNQTSRWSKKQEEQEEEQQDLLFSQRPNL